MGAPFRRLCTCRGGPPSVVPFDAASAHLSALLGGDLPLLVAASRTPMRADLVQATAGETSNRAWLAWIVRFVLAVEHPALTFRITSRDTHPTISVTWPSGDVALCREAHLAAGLAFANAGAAGSRGVDVRAVDVRVGRIDVRLDGDDALRLPPPREAPALGETIRAIEDDARGWAAAEAAFLRGIAACASALASTGAPLGTAQCLVIALVTSCGARQASVRAFGRDGERLVVAVGDDAEAKFFTKLWDGTRLWGLLETAEALPYEVGMALAPMLPMALRNAAGAPPIAERLAPLGRDAVSVALAVAQGRAPGDVATAHGKSESWVRRQLTRVYQRLDIRGVRQLVGLAHASVPKAAPACPLRLPPARLLLPPFGRFDGAATWSAREWLTRREQVSDARGVGRAAIARMMAAVTRSLDRTALAAASRAILSELPGAGAPMRAFTSDEAFGQLDESAAAADHLAAIEPLVAWRSVQLSPPVVRAEEASLTPRQREVLLCRRRGLDNQAIRDALGLQRSSLAKHIGVLRARGLL